jgi:hypothetical protein
MLDKFPQDLIDKITLLLDLESILIIKNVFKRNVYFGIKDAFSPKSIHTWDNCAKNGWLNTIKFLHLEGVPGCNSGVMDIAADNGHLPIVKWLYKNRTEGCKRALDLACINKRYDIAVYLYTVVGAKCRTYFASDFVILLDCLKEVLLAAEVRPYTDMIYNVTGSVDDCIRMLSSAKDKSECYSNLEVLQYVYIGASVSRKKYRNLINGYIRNELKAQGQSKRCIELYFDTCHVLIDKLE